MFDRKYIRHLFLPLSAPAAVVALYFTPKAVFGCVNRGLMALGVVVIALAGALIAARKGVAARRRGESEEAVMWIVTALVLVTPLVLVSGPLG